MRESSDSPGGTVHHRTAGLAMVGFGIFGIALGLGMTLMGVIGTGFLDGPSAMIIGAITALVGGLTARQAARD